MSPLRLIDEMSGLVNTIDRSKFFGSHSAAHCHPVNVTAGVKGQ